MFNTIKNQISQNHILKSMSKEVGNKISDKIRHNIIIYVENNNNNLLINFK